MKRFVTAWEFEFGTRSSDLTEACVDRDRGEVIVLSAGSFRRGETRIYM